LKKKKGEMGEMVDSGHQPTEIAEKTTRGNEKRKRRGGVGVTGLRCGVTTCDGGGCFGHPPKSLSDPANTQKN